MDQHHPVSNIEPTPANISQPADSTQVPLSPNRRLPQNGELESNEPSLICGFTSTELANVAIQVTGIIIAAVFGAWAIKSYESSNIANRLSQNSLSESDAANRLAQAALQQSLYANILAIINICLSDQFRDSTYCPALLQAAPLASIIEGVIPTLSNSTQTRSSSSQLPPAPPPQSSATTPRPPPTTAPTTASTNAPTTESTSQPSSTISITSTSPPLTSLTLTTTIGNPTATSTVGASPLSGGARHIGFGAIVGIIIAVVVTVTFFCLLLIRYRRAKRSRF